MLRLTSLLALLLLAVPVGAQDAVDGPTPASQAPAAVVEEAAEAQDAPPSVEALGIEDNAAAIEAAGEIADEEHGDGEGHGADEGGHHGAMPPVWLVIPFALLLGMIATGPLFYPHFWHHHYPKVAVALGLLVAAYYLLVMGDGIPILHAAEEYFAFIALLGSLYVASGCILIKTDFAGTPRANVILLLVGAVLSNFIGTTGASMLLIRPYMRLNAGRLKAYHIIFFIFIVSNVGGALTPIGDPPLFLGFLRGVPFFWTVVNIWYIWMPTVLILAAVFYVIDGRNKETSLRGVAEAGGADVAPGDLPGVDVIPEAPGVQDVDHIHADEASIQLSQSGANPKKLEIEGKVGFAWLAVIIAAVFIDPKVIPALEGTLIDLHHFGVPFGIREVIMGLVGFAAYKTADHAILTGNDFNFEPIKEVGFLFIGIFLTMQPALTLIGAFAAGNADALGVTSFYFGTGILSGVLDNAPTYVSFLSAAMGKFGMDVNVPEMVKAFSVDGTEAFYLQAISVASVFWGALTYIGNGPNFMVKAIAESSGVDTPSFVAYMVKYSIPILVPIYIVVWFVFFSGYVLPHPPDAAAHAILESPGLMLALPF